MKDDPGAAGAWLRGKIETPYFNLRRWVKCVWFAYTNAKNLAATAQENGRLWGKLATLSDELRFTKRERDELIDYNRMDPVSLAAHYTVEVAVVDDVIAPVREEFKQVLIELVSLQRYVELKILKFKDVPDAIARRMAEDTGRQWVDEIYPKIATALGVPAHKQNPKRLDHVGNQALMSQRDSMMYGGRF